MYFISLAQRNKVPKKETAACDFNPEISGGGRTSCAPFFNFVCNHIPKSTLATQPRIRDRSFVPFIIQHELRILFKNSASSICEFITARRIASAITSAASVPVAFKSAGIFPVDAA